MKTEWTCPDCGAWLSFAVAHLAICRTDGCGYSTVRPAVDPSNVTPPRGSEAATFRPSAEPTEAEAEAREQAMIDAANAYVSPADAERY